MKSITEIYKEIEITVLKEKETWTIYFSYPSTRNDISPQAIRDLPSSKIAMETGKKFVDDHQWKLVEKIDVFDIFTRRSYDGEHWDYKVEFYESYQRPYFLSEEEALIAARIYAQKEISELEEKMATPKS